MTNPNEFMVTVKRVIPYSELTEKEKINLAHTSNNEELLELIANDDSFQVRQSLIKRAARLPDEILCEILSNSENDVIRNEARTRIYNEKILNRWQSKITFLEKFFVFLHTFFDSNFIEQLNEFGTCIHRRQALSAIYLYELKYSFFGVYLPVFKNSFADRFMFEYPYNISRHEIEPYNEEIWELLKSMAYYKYVEDERKKVLMKGLFSNDEIKQVQELKDFISATKPQKLGENWINILAKTLYSLGSPFNNIDKNELDKLKNKLYEAENIEVIEQAEKTLANIYKTSTFTTIYANKIKD